MLLVKTKIGPSKIDGLGLFSDELIKKGRIIWKFVPNFDIELTKRSVKNLSEPARKQVLKYGYFDKKPIIIN